MKSLDEIKSLELLSDIGSEFMVYHDNDLVYKIYKDNYKLDHISLKDLILLSSINTKRILMPETPIIIDNKLQGYTMKYIKYEKDIYKEPMDNIIKELLIIEEDIELLSNLLIRIMDINSANTIYNGSLYLIDPGNYYINNINDLLIYLEGNPTEEDKKTIIRKWNYVKINRLIFDYFFTFNKSLDLITKRKIFEFFENEKQITNEIYDVHIYKKYFDLTLPVKDAINKFISTNIKIEEEERNKLLTLFNRYQ